MSDIVWQSTVTKDMVKDMDENEVEILIADLNDAVEMTYTDWDISMRG